MKSEGTAYMLWLPSIIGVAGLHRFYIGKYGTGILWLFTLGLLGIGSLFDLFTLSGQVKQFNTNVELKTIRKASKPRSESD